MFVYMIRKNQLLIFLPLLFVFSVGLFYNPVKSSVSKKSSIEEVDLVDLEETEEDDKISDAVSILPSYFFFLTFTENDFLFINPGTDGAMNVPEIPPPAPVHNDRLRSFFLIPAEGISFSA